MPEERSLKNESDFFQTLRDKALGHIWFERVEPRTESGFPDTYFVTNPKSGKVVEGCIELKHFTTKTPNLSVLMQPSQKAAFIEYDKAGGRKRFLLAAHKTGLMHFYCSRDVVAAITRGGNASAVFPLFPHPEDEGYDPITRLLGLLRITY